MTDQTPDRLDRLEQTVAYQGRTQAQTDEILLLLASRYQEHDQSLQAVREILEASARLQQQTQQTLDRTAAQQEINTREIAELKAILRERYNGNGNS